MNKQYLQFINELKKNIIQSRYAAARLANKEQLLLYFRIGKMLSEKIVEEKWGSKIIEKISVDLQKQIPGLRGFSSSNLRKMRFFSDEYATVITICSSPTNKLGYFVIGFNKDSSIRNIMTDDDFTQVFYGLSFTHHFSIILKVKDWQERVFYMTQAAYQLWSVNILEHNIMSGLYKVQGKLPNNFKSALPEDLKPTALQVFKDEYLMDFMNLEETSDERKVEEEIVANIKDFILRMGKGFCFIGNQFRIELDGEEYFIDLLFFNRNLQCLVVYELKRGKFLPEYAGKLNFYLNVLDEKVKLAHENSSIGIILCKEKNNTVVEFSIKTIEKGMGVATYKTTKEIPKEMKGILPNADDLANLL